MDFKHPRIGFNHRFIATAVTSSTGRHSPVIDLGGLTLTSIQNSTVGWTDGDIELHGSINTTSTSSMLPVFGSKLGGSVGSTVRVFASFETTANRLTTVDPRLTAGLQYIMIKSSVTQGATRNIVLGLS